MADTRMTIPTVGEESSLRDLVAVPFRHKGKAILFFLLVFGLVALGTFTAPPVFESQAKLLVKPGRESLALDPTVAPERVVDIRRTMQEQMGSELEILNSRVLAERVVDRLGPERFLNEVLSLPEEWAARLWPAVLNGGDPRETAVRRVSRRLQAQARRDTNVLHVTFAARTPDFAREVLDAYVAAYLDHHLEAYRTPGSVAFFTQQGDGLARSLQALEDNLADFRIKASIGDVDDQRSWLQKRIAEAEIKRTDASARLASAQAMVAYLEAALADMPKSIVLQELHGAMSPYDDDARLRLLELRLQEQELLRQYPEHNRLVQTVRAKIEIAQAELAGRPATRTETTTGINKAYQDLELLLLSKRAEAAAAQQEVALLEEHLNRLSADLAALTSAETTLRRMERERDLLERHYLNYRDKQEDVRIAEALETEKVSNIAVVQPASMPLRPVRPRKGLNLFIGLVIGLVGAVGLAFLAERFDHSLRTPKQLEGRLGLPVLGSIPLEKGTELRTVP